MRFSSVRSAGRNERMFISILPSVILDIFCSNQRMSSDYPLFSRTDRAANVLTVGQLTQLIQGTLESTFHSVWVSDEISDVRRQHSGHVYFTLKDESAQIRCVLWRSSASRLRFQLDEGQQV